MLAAGRVVSYEVAGDDFSEVVCDGNFVDNVLGNDASADAWDSFLGYGHAVDANARDACGFDATGPLGYDASADARDSVPGYGHAVDAGSRDACGADATGPGLGNGACAEARGCPGNGHVADAECMRMQIAGNFLHAAGKDPLHCDDKNMCTHMACSGDEKSVISDSGEGGACGRVGFGACEMTKEAEGSASVLA